MGMLRRKSFAGTKQRCQTLSCVTFRVRRHNVDIWLLSFKIHCWERYAGILRRHVAKITSGLCHLCLRDMPAACQRHVAPP